MKTGDTLEFILPDQNGTPVDLSQFRGSPVVLFVYPRADTPGCTAEACEFRDLYQDLKDAGAVLLGISRDTPAQQRKFAEKYSLPYTLLADPAMTALNQLDVIRQGSMYGKPVTRIERSTFILDGEGKLQAEFRAVKPEGHAAEMLAAVRATQ